MEQGCLPRVKFLIRDPQKGGFHEEMIRVSGKNQVKCMFTENYGWLFRLQMKNTIRSASFLDFWA